MKRAGRHGGSVPCLLAVAGSVDALLDPERATPLRFARGEMMALLAVAELGRRSPNASVFIRQADLAGVDMSALGVR